MAGCGDDASTRPPSVQGAVVTTPEDTPVTHTLVVEDVEGAGFRVQISAPMHGTATVDGARVTYTPAENYNGPDAVLVTVIANEHQATATLDFTVTPVNDVPVAVDDSLATDEDVALVTPHTTLLANDTDVDGDTLTITQVGNAVNGTVATAGTEITFTPAQDFVGDASYEYTVSDGTATATATVRIAVGGVNDPPVAVDDAVTTAEDTPIDIPTSLLLANDTDPEGQTLSVVSVANTTNGTVALDGNVVRYQPSPNFNGNMTFEYTVSDGSLTDVGRVTVTVTPVNDAPVAVDDAVTTAEDTPVVITNLTANDTDVDGPALSVTAVANATHGTVSLNGGAVTFTPALNFNGTATFEYTVSDGSLTDFGLVTVTVTPVNDAPVAVDDIAVTPEDTDLVLANLAANDVDVDLDPLTVVAVGNAVNGTVVLNAGVATFTPAPNFNGTASFQYTVSDGSLTDVGLVTITVTPVNDAPVAGPDTATVQAGGTLVIPHATLLANDTDIDGPALSITAVQNATHGTVSLQATTVTFVAEAEFDGTATFEYIVSDGSATAVGLVAVTVVSGPICGDGVVEGAETCDDGNVGTGDGCSATCQVETGWTCSGEPSTCSTVCGDGIEAGAEACDDGNAIETDGCTSECVIGVVCDATAVPGGDRFAVDPATGHCYVSFDGESTTFAGAQAACAATGGYLATITSASEDAVVRDVQNPAETPWIGASEDANDTDDVFAWVTGEPFGYRHFAAGQPDDDASTDGLGDCLHLSNSAGEWNDTNCNATTLVVGRICEIELQACGDHVIQSTEGEECDDGNATGGDGCSATCQIEDGCGDGNLDPGEQCDDDNIVSGDGCSSTCQFEQTCGNGVREGTEECDDGNTGDGDGCSSTCELEVIAPCGNGAIDAGEQCDDGNTTSGDGCSSTCQKETLFFSEYVEGSSNNKALEIKSPFSTPFDLAANNCSVRLYSNGASNPSATLALTGTIVPGDVLVLCHPSADNAIRQVCDIQSSTVVAFNGDDAIDLVCGTMTLDVIGQIGHDPGAEWGSGHASTADNTLRRKCGISQGDPIGNDTFVPSTEWVGYPNDTFNGLGVAACAMP